RAKRALAPRRQPAGLEVDRLARRERRRSAVARLRRCDRARRASGSDPRRAALDLRARLRAAVARASAVSGDRRGRARGVGSGRPRSARAVVPERRARGALLLRMLRFGFWLPVFGGWLRNVDDEKMAATWEYQRDLVSRAEKAGWDVTLIAELNLNDIKGPEADCLEAWTTAAALAAVTERIELMTAVRPNFRLPALVAKEAATIDRISNGRFTLNVVRAWWNEESKQYGGAWIEHDERYARTEEFLSVIKGMWTQDEFTFKGHYYTVEKAHLAPKPAQKPWPVLYAGGESTRAKEMIALECDAYLMHGDPVDVVASKIGDMRERRRLAAYEVRSNNTELGHEFVPELKPLRFGFARYAIV